MYKIVMGPVEFDTINAQYEFVLRTADGISETVDRLVSVQANLMSAHEMLRSNRDSLPDKWSTATLNVVPQRWVIQISQIT